MLPPLIVPAQLAADLDAGIWREWLETDGLGGFAMGTVAGPATRRYHAILCSALKPPVGRMVLVNALEETLAIGGLRFSLSAHFYPGVVYPDGHRALVEFRLDPWPLWTYRVGGVKVERTLFMRHGSRATVVSWRVTDGAERVRLFVRPLLSGRDYHALHHENDCLRSEVEIGEGRVTFAPYPGVPAVFAHHNGVYSHSPDWYRQVEYPRERERGLPHIEDLWSPGELAFDLGLGDAPTAAVAVFGLDETLPDVSAWRSEELARRKQLIDGAQDATCARLRLAGDRLIVPREGHQTVIAGYPWFTDWGRDTFISLPGLMLIPGGRELARELLLAFAPHVRGGLIPNRFPDAGEAPEYNSVDAPLWFVLAVCRYARHSGDRAMVRERLMPAVRQIFDGYLGGTGYDIGVDDDGLIHAGVPGTALTWMDARVGDWVVTPRHGKPVEIQALWVAALEAVARLCSDDDASWAHELHERAAWARSSFASLFWDDNQGWLYDVVDGARRDGTLRPNQLYALGLCAPLIEPARAERALAAVERELLVRVGLRTRARGEGYLGRITGNQHQRDSAYHQGTVWPYLIGIFADACQRVRGSVPVNLTDGLVRHLLDEGLGNVAEIFDGDAPHAPRGCPAQAWSIAELLRVQSGQVGADS